MGRAGGWVRAAAVRARAGNGSPAVAQLTGNRFAALGRLHAAEAVEAALGTITPIDPRW